MLLRRATRTDSVFLIGRVGLQIVSVTRSAITGPSANSRSALSHPPEPALSRGDAPQRERLSRRTRRHHRPAAMGRGPLQPRQTRLHLGNADAGRQPRCPHTAGETDNKSARPRPDTRQYVAASTGTGKTHLAIAIARSCIRAGARGRFYNVVDLVNRLETETRNSAMKSWHLKPARLPIWRCK